MPELGAWTREPRTYDEKGWRAWNNMSPEKEFAEFAAALVNLVKPALIVETGVGQGFVTRRIAKVTDVMMFGYESGEEWYAALKDTEFWQAKNHVLCPGSPPTYATADLTLLDSQTTTRIPEIKTWYETASPGALVLIHDAYKPRIRRAIERHGIRAVELPHARSSFLGQR